MQIIATILIVALAVTAVAAIPISQSGNGTPNNLGTATSGYTSAAANCGQVEIDLFNLGSTGAPLHDLFQYITSNGGQGVNFASTTPYVISLPTAIFNGGVDLQIILSSLQGSYNGATGVEGPFNASIDTISVQLNGQTTLTQNFNIRGNNFTFNTSNTPFQGSSNSIVVNNFTVIITQTFPAQSTLQTNSTCSTQYVLSVNNPANTTVRGDPQFVGLRGQTYQVHGIDGAVYNVISGRQYQMNARFSFLEGPRPCPLMPTTNRKSSACWSHAGSYLSELGIKSGQKELYIEAGPAATGFESVVINGRTVKVGESSDLFSFNSTHEMTISFGEWTIEVENSDMFVNLRSVRVAPDAWSKLASHGLLGQTWSNKRYSGTVPAIEGEVDDYMVAEDSVFGDSFLFNQYQ